MNSSRFAAINNKFRVSNVFHRALAPAALTLASICAGPAAHAQYIYVTDSGTNSILQISVVTGVKTTFASSLSNPRGIAVDAAGNVYEADSGSGTIFKFDKYGTKTTFKSGLGVGQMNGLAVDSTGVVYEAESTANLIRKFTAAGVLSTTYNTLLNTPQGLAVDASDNLYEADNGTGTIFKYTSLGSKSNYSTANQVPGAYGMDVDSTGKLYVSETTGPILKFTAANTASTFETGASVKGLAFDNSNNLYSVEGTTIVKATTSAVRSTFSSGFTAPQFAAFSSVPEPGVTALGTGTCAMVGMAFLRKKKTRKD
ncbi:MAG: NHL repeat-containing protein [Chthonomonadales bacterium]